jgi:hypothetical protein
MAVHPSRLALLAPPDDGFEMLHSSIQFTCNARDQHARDIFL